MQVDREEKWNIWPSCSPTMLALSTNKYSVITGHGLAEGCGTPSGTYWEYNLLISKQRKSNVQIMYFTR